MFWRRGIVLWIFLIGGCFVKVVWEEVMFKLRDRGWIGGKGRIF